MLKVIQINENTELIKQSLQNNRKAQKKLYEKYSPKMLSLCAYYIKDIQQSEEVMLNGFLKVFNCRFIVAVGRTEGAFVKPVIGILFDSSRFLLF